VTHLPSAAVAPMTAVLACAALLAGCARSDAGAFVAASRAARSPTVVADLPACPGAGGRVESGPTVAGGLPDLELPCLGQGGPVRLSELRGPLVLNVWASWCPPCRAELPTLAEVASQATGRVTFLGVDVLDDSAAAAELVRAVRLPYGSVVDAEGATRGPLRWVGPPLTLFVDADGRVAHARAGELDGADELRALIAEHLGVRL